MFISTVNEQEVGFLWLNPCQAVRLAALPLGQIDPSMLSDFLRHLPCNSKLSLELKENRTPIWNKMASEDTEGISEKAHAGWPNL